jgi:heptaprenyl diphosphate synthase
MAMKPKKLVLLALLTAIALTVFLIEAQIPPIVPIPGVRLGLANIVTVFAVFAIGSREGAAVLLCRIFLGAVFAGNFSTILYSAAGGFCAIAVTVGMKKLLTTRQLWVAGALGAMAHNIGQMAAAVAISQTPSLVIYLPLLLAIAIVTGSLTGLSAQILLHRGEKLWKTFLP